MDLFWGRFSLRVMSQKTTMVGRRSECWCTLVQLQQLIQLQLLIQLQVLVQLQLP
jgi:hypothetical protein